MNFRSNLLSYINRIRLHGRGKGVLKVILPKLTVQAKPFSHKAEDTNGYSTGMTVANVKAHWSKIFQERNIPDADSSVDHILVHLLKLKNVAELNKSMLQAINQEIYNMLIEKLQLRLLRMPVQYIIQEWDFLDMTLKMSPPVFIPRPETENLVIFVSEVLISRNLLEKSENLKFLEIGCGTGAISLSLLKRHPKLNGTAIDANPAAVCLANENADLHQLGERFSVSFRMLKNDGSVTGKPSVQWDHTFDLLVSNPPYIPSYEISTLPPEVRNFESHLALDGGPNGTTLIETIIQHGSRFLKKGGLMFLEIDPRQVGIIKNTVKHSPVLKSQVIVEKDCFGVERLVLLECK